MKKINKKGFTLIELLAVIVIMGILMMVAIPSVNLIIIDARKDIYVNSARTFINEAEKEVLNSTFEIDDLDTTYYIHIANLVDDPTNLGKSGFATWGDSYVVATMALVNNKVTTNYYFNSVDLAGWKISLIGRDNLAKRHVYQDSIKKIEFLPVGNRKKIVVYDKNGNIDKTKGAFVSLDGNDASKCYEYTKNKNAVTITKYKVACGIEAVIPDEIEGLPVSSIGSHAFANKNLISIRISKNVSTIGWEAFAYNNLTSVVIPEGVKTITEGAFFKNKISSLVFPNKGLETIGARSFQNNQLTQSSAELVPDPMTKIGTCAFCNNKISHENAFTYLKNSDGTVNYEALIGYMGDTSKLSNKTFVIPESKNGVSLKVIKSNAFHRNALSGFHVVIPNTVTDIESGAFSMAGITSVDLPSDLKKIGAGAFSGNKLQNLVIPNSVTSIGNKAFNSNSVVDNGANEVWIYNRTNSGVDYTKIIGYAGGTVTNLTMPESKNGVKLQVIANQALEGLNVTGTFKLPKNVKYTGDMTFYNISAIKIDNGDGVLTDGFVYGRNSDGTINNKYLYSYTIRNQRDVKIPSNIETIGGRAFSYTRTKSVIFNEGLKRIGTSAFDGCNLEGTVTLPSTLTTLDGNALYMANGSNSTVTKIINKTGKSFNWKVATGMSNAGTFETGTFKNNRGEVVVTNK